LIFPDIKELMEKMDSRYTLVVAAAKRARQLTDGAVKMTRARADKPVTIAIHEIAEGKIRFSREHGEKSDSGGGRAVGDGAAGGVKGTAVWLPESAEADVFEEGEAAEDETGLYAADEEEEYAEDEPEAGEAPAEEDTGAGGGYGD
jgi:DNA-directed RNA polymerase subunit omega